MCLIRDKSLLSSLSSFILIRFNFFLLLGDIKFIGLINNYYIYLYMYSENNNLNQQLKIWLFVLLSMIILIILIGGLTRLTDSGLSITTLELFVGFLPPLTNDKWKDYFYLYKTIPEYS